MEAAGFVEPAPAPGGELGWQLTPGGLQQVVASRAFQDPTPLLAPRPLSESADMSEFELIATLEANGWACE
eukprot:11472340-Alexandrium_andersonii.AAC.1